MKKITALLAVAMLVLALPANAQFKYGLKAGLDISKPSFDKDVVSADNRTGFFVGPMAEFTVPVVGIGVDAALLYDNKSIKVAGESETLQMINLPVNLKYTYGLGSIAGVFVTTGPQFGWNIGNTNLFKYESYARYTMKSSQFSWNVGAGAKLLGHLQIAYNYNIACGKTAGQANAAKIETAGGVAWQAVTGKMKNNTHQISLAYTF